MNAYRAERCCRATCTRIADGMGLRHYVVTHAGYIDVNGSRIPADSMVAEALEVRQQTAQQLSRASSRGGVSQGKAVVR